MLALIICIDVVSGPILTFIVYNKNKSRNEMLMDLGLIGLLQICTLLYGLHVAYSARPIYLVFEVDRFAVVSDFEISDEVKKSIPDNLKKKYFTGPFLIGVRSAGSGAELIESIELSSNGVEPRYRVGWWQDYELNRRQVVEKMKKLSDLRRISIGNDKILINDFLMSSNEKIDNLFFLPLVKHDNLEKWTVILNMDGDIVGYLPVNGFL